MKGLDSLSFFFYPVEAQLDQQQQSIHLSCLAGLQK